MNKRNDTPLMRPSHKPLTTSIVRSTVCLTLKRVVWCDVNIIERLVVKAMCVPTHALSHSLREPCLPQRDYSNAWTTAFVYKHTNALWVKMTKKVDCSVCLSPVANDNQHTPYLCDGHSLVRSAEICSLALAACRVRFPIGVLSIAIEKHRLVI